MPCCCCNICAELVTAYKTAVSSRPFPDVVAASSWRWPPEFGARGQLHLEGRAPTQGRLHPDAPAVHLDNLLGNGEPEARAAFGLGKRAVDLMELIEDPILLIKGYARSGVCHQDCKMVVPRGSGDGRR